MLVIVLDCGLISVTTICNFVPIGLSTPSLPTLYLKDPRKVVVVTHFILNFFLAVLVVIWNNLPKCWQLKDKKTLH